MPKGKAIRPRPHESYPVRTVARLTGLSPDVIRAWEKRHRVVAPVRGPRGARLYTADDVEQLRLLATLVARGRAIGDIAALDRHTLETLVHGSREGASAAGPGVGDASGAHPVRRALRAIERFDGVDIERQLSEALLALGGVQFVQQVALPLLTEIGHRWRAGRLSVADEHLVSGVLRNLLGGLLRLHGGGAGSRLLLAAPSGERHEFGLLLVALLVTDLGLGVHYLGSDVPDTEIVNAALRAGVVAVGLTLVNQDNHWQAVEQVQRIERGLPGTVELWLGGADADAIARELGHTRALVLQQPEAIESHARRVRQRSAPAR